MLKVRKDAIKVKTSDGMQSTGVLCKVGTFGVDNIQYVTAFASMFANAEFPTGYVLELNLDSLGKRIVSSNEHSMNYMFQSATGVEKIILRTQQKDVVTTWYQTFNKTSAKEIDISEFPVLIKSATQTFYHNYNVEVIKGEFRFSDDVSNITNMFGSTTNLKEVRFAKNTIKLSIAFAQSPLLSDDSIQSIIDGLMDLTGQTAQTLTFHADVKAKLTAEQIATITSKNWTIP